jgi:hypothetical protein
MSDNSDTPVTNAAEQFMIYETPPPTMDYDRRLRPYRAPVGFVLSDVARRLEREVNKLRALLEKNQQ